VTGDRPTRRRARRPALFSSLRARVVAWNILTLAVLLGALGATLPFLVRSAMLASVDRDLVDRAHRFLDHPPPEAGLPPPPARDADFPAPPFPPSRRRPPGGRPPEAEGTLRPRFLYTAVADTNGPTPWDRQVLAQAAQGRAVYSTVTHGGEPLRVLSLPVPPRGPVLGVLQVPYSLAELHRAIAGLNRTLLLLAPLALLCAGVGGSLLTGRALRPVQQIAHAAQRIGADALHERLPAHGDDEFARLAATFNRMLARLEEAFATQQQLIARLRTLVEQQRRFTADASHELRTPLTAIKANASLTLSGDTRPEEWRRSMEEINTAASAMARLVDDLLLLARSDSGQLARDPIELPLRELVVQAIARVRAPDRAPITLGVEDEALTVHGCEDELTRLFSNLLENAARHTPADGTITVTARREADSVLIDVADSGCGIAPEHLPHLGERFYRVDTARARADGGSGLGLSICRGIAEAHGGEISFRSTPGAGTTARVTLPGSRESR
jgi:signal transduction histidine kinase